MPAHLSQMTPARGALYALLVCATSAPSASACCLTDWLYGRQPAYASVPVTPGYAVGTAPYTAGYAPVVTSAPSSSLLPLTGTGSFVQPSSVQQPAYGAVPLNNPSVYSDPSIALGYRGAVPAGGGPFGTGNVYPNNYQANMGSSVQLPVTPTYAAQRRGGLARFFDSLLGTEYRSSYYTAPITYYRPATTVDPITGTTVTVQQPCASTVQQLQRTPYATFQPSPSYAQTSPIGTSCDIDPNTGIAACNATSPYDRATGMSYGASPIPSTVAPDGYASPAYGNAGNAGNADLQPLAPPALPPSPSSNFSGRLSYPESDAGDAYSNLSPLTGDSFSDSPSYQREVQPDLDSSSQRSAKPAYSDQQDRSAAVDDAYRQGYEAGRTATQNEADENAPSTYSRDAAPEKTSPRPYGSDPSTGDSDLNESGAGPQLSPPENNRPSTGDTRQRTPTEIERDEQDLHGLMTGTPATPNPSRLVYGASDMEPRVRPIPAPDDYRNPFDTSEPLKAPDFLPALPPPSASHYRAAPRTSNHANPPQRLSVPVREASIQGPGDRVPARSSRDAAPRRAAEADRSYGNHPRANAWQSKIRQQSQESGWYTKGS